MIVIFIVIILAAMILSKTSADLLYIQNI